jgi:hypothetical protein
MGEYYWWLNFKVRSLDYVANCSFICFVVSVYVDLRLVCKLQHFPNKSRRRLLPYYALLIVIASRSPLEERVGPRSVSSFWLPVLVAVSARHVSLLTCCSRRRSGFTSSMMCRPERSINDRSRRPGIQDQAEDAAPRRFRPGILQHRRS